VGDRLNFRFSEKEGLLRRSIAEFAQREIALLMVQSRSWPPSTRQGDRVWPPSPWASATPLWRKGPALPGKGYYIGSSGTTSTASGV